MRLLTAYRRGVEVGSRCNWRYNIYIPSNIRGSVCSVCDSVFPSRYSEGIWLEQTCWLKLDGDRNGYRIVGLSLPQRAFLSGLKKPTDTFFNTLFDGIVR